MTSDAFYGWAADRLLEDIRRGEVPEGLTPGDVAWDPMSTAVRARIEPQDRDVARRLAAEPETATWGAFLGRAFLDDETLTRLIVDQHEHEHALERKIGLFHHVTARHLNQPQREHLERWVQGHLDAFVDEQRLAFSDADGADRLAARIESEEPGFRAKRWAYMYSALALPAVRARALLSLHRDGDDPVVASAARTALSHLV